MSQRTLARPYAKAVFETAKAQNAFEKWGEMLDLAANIANSSDMKVLIKDPRMGREVIVDCFLRVGQNVFNETMQNVCKTLAAFNRLELLPDIYELYDEMRQKEQRYLRVELKSAYAIDDAFQERLKQALKQKLNCDIHLDCIIDGSILGGAIIRAGDLLIDGSAQGRLTKLLDAIGII